ncbi:HNH endonuclease [Parasutterella muris]|uniref:HNH nuclease domain-containing protein n=1 Tax=Parasutterella muris TaxID=2565572 RepID=A0A6L6YHI5_9BURK|nr:HNH endonuclease signature motif containing protein [Parasutterella muris]MVX56854.1 hypothetical protein [Parasutterella muris]
MKIVRLNWTDKACPISCIEILEREKRGYWKSSVSVRKKQKFLLYKCKSKSNAGIIGFGYFTRDGAHTLDKHEIEKYRLNLIENAESSKFVEIQLIELNINRPLVNEKELNDFFGELKNFATQGSTVINYNYQPQAVELYNRLLIKHRYKACESNLSKIDNALASENVKTEIRKEVTHRIGQAWLREQLLELHHGMCQVSDETRQDLLICSHIIPWSEDRDNRLNPNNALLLAFNYDFLFDKGYITFDDDGTIITSKEVRNCFGIEDGRKLRELNDETRVFLKYHRERIFKR